MVLIGYAPEETVFVSTGRSGTERGTVRGFVYIKDTSIDSVGHVEGRRPIEVVCRMDNDVREESI